MISERIVSEARQWKGTRWQHQGRIKGTGVDCVNFISEVARAAGVGVEIPGDYRPQEDGTVMLQLLRKHMTLVETMQPGDVLALCDEALREPDIPCHLAIVTEIRPHTSMIIEAGQKCVVEHRMDTHWLKRVHSIWRINEQGHRSSSV